MYMVNTFSIKDGAIQGTDNISCKATDDFFKCIRDRTKICRKPTCWELKDPKDNGQIYLPRQFFNERRGRQVQIRQALFQLIFQVPAPVGRKIMMACGNKRCLNPLHMRVAGWKIPWCDLERYLVENNPDVGWITRDQAKLYHGYDPQKRIAKDILEGEVEP